uniref:Chloroplast envelope membrane protein n=1 Tax=Chenopodium quinoa TaxID=63459 RepID=A0A803ND98_CHEQI
MDFLKLKKLSIKNILYPMIPHINVFRLCMKDGNWLGLREEDLEEFEEESKIEVEGSDKGERDSEKEKFEAWKNQAEALIELREAQEGIKNEENRNWDDWLVFYEGNGAAKFLVVLIIVPWAMDFLVHDYVLMPFLDSHRHIPSPFTAGDPNHSFLQHCRHSTSPLYSTATTSIANHFPNPCLPIGTTIAQLQQQKLLHHNLNLDLTFDKTPKTAILNQRFHYSSESTPNPNPSPSMKYQEIEGPTVEKDELPLANESKEVTQSLLKTMYNVSGTLALLGLAHLGIGTYYCCCYTN